MTTNTYVRSTVPSSLLKGLTTLERIDALSEDDGKHKIWIGAFENRTNPVVFHRVPGQKGHNVSVRRFMWQEHREKADDPSTILGEDMNVVAGCGDYRCIAPACLQRIQKRSVIQRVPRYANTPSLALMQPSGGPVVKKRRRINLTAQIDGLGGTSALDNRYRALLEKALMEQGPQFRHFLNSLREGMVLYFGDDVSQLPIFKTFMLDMAIQLSEESDANK